MKSKFAFSMLLLFCIGSLGAQQVQQPLSKTAKNGALYNYRLEPNGNLELVYGYSAKKEQKFVNYVFDSNFKLIKEEESANPYIKEKEKPTQKYDYIYTSVGGCSSFDILSMNLNVSKISLTKTWNSRRQEYDTDMKEQKISSGKDGKFKYKGYVGYYDANTGSSLVLVKEKEKDDAAQYRLIRFDLNMEVTEIPLGELGSYSLVFSGLVKRNPDQEDIYDEKNLAEYNAFFIMAPPKGSTDAKNFVCFFVDQTGKTVSKFNIKMPFVASTVMQMRQNGKDIYLFGFTNKAEVPMYRAVFMDFTNIKNPCYPDFYNYRDNQREMDVMKKEANNIMLIKMTDQKVEYISLTSVDDLQAKKVVPPSVKKAPKDPFSRFKISAFDILPNGDLLVTGQKKVIITLDQQSRYAYEDITCFHFDKNGVLRAEYCIEPILATSKTDKIFEMQQYFIPSPSGNAVYWLVYEPEGKSGYSSYSDAINDRKTIYANYQLEIFKIDLATAKLSNSEMPLGKEFLSYNELPFILSDNGNEAIFLGHSRKDDMLGLSKYIFK